MLKSKGGFELELKWVLYSWKILKVPLDGISVCL